jgi:choline-sulfatase
VGFPGPHEPWDTPEPWASAYDPAGMPRPTPPPESVAERSRGLLDERLANRPNLTPDDVAALRANYAGGVSLIDHLIGRIIDTVKARDEWDRTIVAFASDHGEMNGDAGLLFKGTFLDGSARVPLVIRDPHARIDPGQVISDPVELIDLGPTLLELAGVESPQDSQLARSVAPVVRAGAALRDFRRDALCEFDGECMLVTRNWKLAVNSSGQTYLLFHRDDGETKNVAGDPGARSIEQALRSRLLERLVTTSTRRPLFGAPPTDSTRSATERFAAGLRHRVRKLRFTRRCG